LWSACTKENWNLNPQVTGKANDRKSYYGTAVGKK
jgi:hypothetical protein